MATPFLATAYPGGMTAIVCAIIWIIAGVLGIGAIVVGGIALFLRRPRLFRFTSQWALGLILSAMGAVVIEFGFVAWDVLNARQDRGLMKPPLAEYLPRFAGTVVGLVTATVLRARGNMTIKA